MIKGIILTVHSIMDNIDVGRGVFLRLRDKTITKDNSGVLTCTVLMIENMGSDHVQGSWEWKVAQEINQLGIVFNSDDLSKDIELDVYTIKHFSSITNIEKFPLYQHIVKKCIKDKTYTQLVGEYFDIVEKIKSINDYESDTYEARCDKTFRLRIEYISKMLDK